MLSSAFSAVAVTLLPFVAGCSDDDPVVVDVVAPFAPDGVFSITGDRSVEIRWNENLEADLAGYAVFRSTAFDGAYNHLNDVAVDAFCADDPYRLCYTDTNLNNGTTWFYAVTAFDLVGNESELSYENVFDTPRPAGTGLVLNDLAGQDSTMSGYDFSSKSGAAQLWSAATTDIYFGASAGVNYIWAAPQVDIQDFGWTFDMNDLNFSPDVGWAPSGRVEAIFEHGYFVRVVDGSGVHFAKVRVTAVSSPVQPNPDLRSMTVDWAYQEDENNPQLAPGVKAGASN